MTYRAQLIAMYFLCGLWFAGCDPIDVEHPDGDEAWRLAHQIDESAEVVARVDGRPITAREVSLEWRRSPELEAHQVLEQLIDRELLAGAAREGDYHESEEISFVRKQAMVSALLADEVEGSLEDHDVGERRELRSRVEGIRRAPEGIRASHLVILIPEEIQGADATVRRLSKSEREDLYEEGRHFVDRAIERLEGRVDDDALRQVAAELDGELSEREFQVLVNEHLRFPRAGEHYEREHLPSGWISVVPEFSAGAEELARENRFGELSQPLRTSFGWHLIRIDEVIEARQASEESVEAYVDYELDRRAKQRRYSEFVDGLAEDVKAQIHPERLGSVFGD